MGQGFKGLRRIAVSAISAASIIGSITFANAAELKIAHFMPATHPMDKGVMTPLAEELTKATNGELTIRIFPSGELGKGPAQQYKRVVTGVADIVFGIPEYTPKRFSKTAMVHLPGLFSGGEAATNALWDNIELLADEYEKTKLLGLWANNPSVLITRDKAVRTVADMQGMKIRTPNPVMADLVKAWGAIPVSMPTIDTYNAMNTGVIDAVMIGPSGIRSYKLNETAKYVTTNIPSALDSFYLLMNKSSWDNLSDEHKATLENLTGRELSLRGAKSFFKAGQAGLELAKETGLELIEIDADADEAFRTQMQDALSAFVDKVGTEKNIDASALVDALAGKS